MITKYIGTYSNWLDISKIYEFLVKHNSLWKSEPIKNKYTWKFADFSGNQNQRIWNFIVLCLQMD